MGIGVATLYLMLPYTEQMTGRVDHVLPAAFLVWAVLCYPRPLVAGMFMGLACTHNVLWEPQVLEEKVFLGFRRSLDLFGDGTVHLIYLPGHTAGHTGVAITVGEKHYLHLGDGALFEAQFTNPGIIAFGTKIFRAIANQSSSEE